MLTGEMARKFDFESTYPVLIITDAESGGMAARVGLAPGDLILEINGAAISRIKELSLSMEKIAEGDMVQMKIMRISFLGIEMEPKQIAASLRTHKGPSPFGELPSVDSCFSPPRRYRTTVGRSKS